MAPPTSTPPGSFPLDSLWKEGGAAAPSAFVPPLESMEAETLPPGPVNALFQKIVLVNDPADLTYNLTSLPMSGTGRRHPRFVVVRLCCALRRAAALGSFSHRSFRSLIVSFFSFFPGEVADFYLGDQFSRVSCFFF